MRRILLSSALLLFQMISAQDFIAFEASEGYTTGNIDTQNGWQTTSTGTANITGQTVSTDKAKDGTRSLKITKETAYSGQTNPVIGAFKTFSSPIVYTDFTISFDINITDQSTAASLYEFQTIGDGASGRTYVIRLRFVETGTILVAQTTGTQSTFATTTGTWEANTWYRVRIQNTPTGLEYFLNDVSIYTGNYFTQYNFDEIAFVHDNFLGSAYIDRIAINNEGAVLSVKTPIDTKEATFSVFPNPTADYVNIETSEAIENIDIYTIDGKKMNTRFDGKRADVSQLAEGNYLIKITTSQGIQTKKFIKK